MDESSGSNIVEPFDSKKPRLEDRDEDIDVNNQQLPDQPNWLPSASADIDLVTSCGTSEDSGLSDSTTPPPYDVVDSTTPPPPSTSQGVDVKVDGDDDSGEDDMSSLSGLSDMSGQDWKPDMSGKLAWLNKAMARGEDPRKLLLDILPGGTSIPDNIDTMTLWKVLFNLLSEPPKREKLTNVNTIEDCVSLIRSSSNIIVLTGAGVSVSCGIPDFRSRDGVYARLAIDFPDLPDPQAMFDIHYFRKDPRPFYKFAREIYPGQFSPSPCHRFIRCLEEQESLLRNYTQNIDTLEQVAGIERVIQCHGSFATASCTVCGVKVDAEVIRTDIFDQNIPFCSNCPKPNLDALMKEIGKTSNSDTDVTDEIEILSQSKETELSCLNGLDDPQPGSSKIQFAKPSPSNNDELNVTLNSSPFTDVPIMKPDIVFFGEGLPDHFHNSITSDKSSCDLLIVIGSSLKVRPVALIPSSLSPDVPQILINREPLHHCNFDVELLGDCDAIINQICVMLGQGWEGPVHHDSLKQYQGDIKELHSIEVVDDNAINEPTKEEINLKGARNPSEEPPIDPNNAADAIDSDSAQEKVNSRRSIAESLPLGNFYFQAPSRYVFPGAEVFADDSDDEDDYLGSDDDNTSRGAPEQAGNENKQLEVDPSEMSGKA